MAEREAASAGGGARRAVSPGRCCDGLYGSSRRRGSRRPGPRAQVGRGAGGPRAEGGAGGTVRPGPRPSSPPRGENGVRETRPVRLVPALGR